MRTKSNAVPEGIRVNIEIDGEVWTRVGSFEDSRPHDKHYVVKEENGRTEIIFGDGEKGQRPSSGSAITVRYRDGSGESGNVRRKRLKISFDWDRRC